MYKRTKLFYFAYLFVSDSDFYRARDSRDQSSGALNMLEKTRFTAQIYDPATTVM